MEAMAPPAATAVAGISNIMGTTPNNQSMRESIVPALFSTNFNFDYGLLNGQQQA